MKYQKQFDNELNDSNTQYFILDTKGSSKNGDIDFVQYQWDRSRYNLLKKGDLCIFRRTGKSSENGKFYFYGAAKIKEIKGSRTLTGLLEKPYPFRDFLFQDELDNFIWTWKKRGKNWEHFFNQYGMNKINKVDFENLILASEGLLSEDSYDPEAATDATQNIQKGNYTVDDKEGITKLRSKQQAFSNKVKANYGNKCAICFLSTKHFLVGSHIIPWSTRNDTRLDPSNGICLCSFHDKAFDKGFIAIDESYKIIVTDSKILNTDSVLFEMLNKIRGKSLLLPKVDKPNKDFLQFHRNNIFDKF